MVYRKRKSSAVLELAEVRASGLAAIDPQIDFGEGRSLNQLNQLSEQLHDKLAEYNTELTQVDTLRLEIQDLEKALGDLSSKMLTGVAFQYGKDSLEYQMAGGVRKRDRIHRSSVARLKAEETPPAEAD